MAGQTSAAHASLQGTGVLVTRPAHQADSLCAAIEAAGGEAIRFPTLEIAPPADSAAITAQLQQLLPAAMVIFVSANAAQWAWQVLGDDGLARCLDGAQVAAMGAQTASVLATHDVRVDIIPPAPQNSESLLAMPIMQSVGGKRIIVFRGEGGREHLAEILRQRGAEVSYVAVYRRQAPLVDCGPILQRWQRGDIHVVTALSNETLQNLYDILGPEGRPLLLQTPLVLMSRRAAELADQLGFQHAPIIARDASVDALLEALQQWRQSQN
jgi:uroporphyrinogen-III synthase